MDNRLENRRDRKETNIALSYKLQEGVEKHEDQHTDMANKKRKEFTKDPTTMALCHTKLSK